MQIKKKKTECTCKNIRASKNMNIYIMKMCIEKSKITIII